MFVLRFSGWWNSHYNHNFSTNLYKLLKNPNVQKNLYMEMIQNISVKYTNQEVIKEDLRKFGTSKSRSFGPLKAPPSGAFCVAMHSDKRHSFE